ncbi:MAG: class I SAM-dependent methyltransferase [Kofleriaceae bacterium]|nr:class I SAM-dependent methyltransferase [Kofleriaceae bacterium]
MLRSVLRKQVARLLPAAWQNRVATWRERVSGVDFTQPVSLDSLGLDAARSVKYSPSDDHHLRQLLDGLTIRTTDRILDYGCGKGRALRTMTEYPFASTDGVELSPALAATARRNFIRLHVPSDRVHIFVSDAATFTALDDYTHFYFYNPFPAVVMRPVIANIYASIDRRARDLTIIYYNAVCLDDFLAAGRFRVIREATDDEGNRSVILSLQGRG